VIQVGGFLVGEVGEIATRLRGDPCRRLGPPIPLEKEEDLPGRREKATPTIRRKLGSKSAPAVFLANPVVEADLAKVNAGGGEVHEEAVGLQVVDHMKAVVAGVPGTFNMRSGRLVLAGREHAGPPRRYGEHGRESVQRADVGCCPAVEEVVLAEPLGACLGATLAVEEEPMQLVDVQIAVLTY
jgi:hypothetical protein